MSDKKKQSDKADQAEQDLTLQTPDPDPVATVATPPKKDGPMMYVGPTISGLAIQNVVYSSIPSTIETVKKEVPEIINLFIPVSKYGDAERMIRTGSGYLYNAFVKALEFKEKRNRGGNN